MKLILLAFAVILVVVQGQESASKAIGYHAAIGIPEAKRIRFREPIKSRIIGGMTSYDGENPFLAGVIVNLTSGDTSVCAGTLLNRRKVLTAAQCWFDGYLQGETITVVFGSTELFSGGEQRTVYSVVAHPKFDPFKLINDLAMLTIPGVSYSSYINPASLPVYQPNASFVGVTAKAIGFGVTGDRMEVSTTQIQHSVFVPVIANEECAAVYNGSVIDDEIICTSGTNHWGPCVGDSGAPLVYNSYPGENMLIGVASFHASAGCQSGYPFGYMRVTAYLDWIQGLLY